MAINAGTILAYLDLDTSKFGNALQTAESQMTSFAQEGGGVSSALNGIGAGMTTVGQALTMGVTTPLLGVGVAAVKTGMDFDAQMSRVKAISGATEEEFSTLRAAAIQMGADSVFGATDAAQALEYMGMAGWKTDQMIAGLPGIINLAAASGENLGTVSDIVTDALTAFGLSAADSAHFADVLAAASSNSNTNVGLMGETFKYVAPLAGALGYSAEDCAVAIGLMANSGIKGGQAGTALRGMLTNLSKPTDQVAAAMEKYGISLTDAAGNMLPFSGLMGNLRGAFSSLTEAEKVELAATLAGQEGMSGLLAIVNASEADFNKLTDAVNDSAGATERMASQMLDNLKGDFEGLSGGLESAALAFSDFITPAIRTVTQALTRAVDWFNNLDDGVKNVVFRAGTIAAAIGPALMIGGKALSLVSGFISPLALLAGGLALVYKNSETVQNAVAKAKDVLVAAFGNISEGIKVFAKATGEGKSKADALSAGLTRAFGPAASSRVMGFLTKFKANLSQAKNAVFGVVDGLSVFVGSMIDGKGVTESLNEGLARAFGPEIASKLSGVTAAIGNGFSTAKTVVSSFVDNVREGFTSFKQYTSDAATKLAEDWREDGALGVLKGVGELMHDALTKGAELAKKGASAVREKVAEGLAMAKEWLAPKAAAWLSNLGTAYQEAKAYATEKLPVVRDAILNGLQAAKTTVTSKARSVLTWMGEAYRSEEVQTALGNLSGVATSIMGKITAAKEAVTTKAGELLTSLGDAMGSEEVKAKITEITGVAATIAEKITSGAGAWKVTAGKLIGDLIGQLTDNEFLQTVVTGLGNVAVAIINGIGTATANATEGATSILTTLITKLTETGFVETVFTTGATVANALIDVIGNAVANGLTAATAIITTLVNGFSSIDWAAVFSTAGAVANKIVDMIGAAVTNGLTAATTIITSLIGGLSSIDWAAVFTTAGDVANKIVDMIGAAVTNGLTAATSLVSAIIDGLGTVDWAAFGTGLSGLATKLLDGILNNLPATVEGVGSLVDKIGEGIASAGTALGTAAGKLISGLVSWLLTPENWAKLLQAGESLVNGITSGIVNLGYNALKGAASFVVETLGGAVDGLATGLTNIIVGGARAMLGVEVDKELEAKTLAMFDKIYTVFDSQGQQVEMCGMALTDALSTSMMQTGQIEMALQAWDVVVSEGISGAFTDAAWLANDAIVGLFAIVADKTMSEGERAKAAAVLIGAGYGDVFENALYASEPQVVDAAYSLMDGANAEVEAAVAALGASVPGAITTGLESGIPILEAASEKVAEVASGTQDKVDTLANAKAVGEEAVESVAEGEGDTGEVEDASQGVSDAITDTMEPLPGLMEEIAANGVTGMQTSILAGESQVTTATNTVTDAAVQKALQNMSTENGRKIGIQFGGGITTGVRNKQGEMTAAASAVSNAAKSAASGILSSGAGSSIGRQIVQGIINGVGSMGGALNSKMRSLANSAVSAFKAALQMHSPPKVFEDIGKLIPLAIGIGTEGNEDAATKPILQMAKDMTAAWPDVHLPAFMTSNSGKMQLAFGADGGVTINHYGDWVVREEADIERIGAEIREEFVEIMRGGNA